MKLNLTRNFFLLLLSIFSLLSGAQTLYWVGGSGNFNDPKHWSLSSGGASAKMVPNEGTDVVFDDNSFSGNSTVQLGIVVNVRSFLVSNLYNDLNFSSTSGTELRIRGSIVLNGKVQFADKIKFFAQGGHSGVQIADFAGKQLHSDIDFVSGKWQLKSIELSHQNTARFLSGIYSLEQSFFSVGNLVANSESITLSVDNSLFRIKGNFTISPALKIKSNNSQIEFDIEKNKLSVDPSVFVGENNRIIGNGNPVAVCGLTLTGVNPLCGSGTNSTGTIFVSIDPTCVGVYTLQFVSGCAPPATQTVSAGQTYTFTGFASCGTPYQAVIIQGGVPINFSNSLLILGPSPVVFFPFLQIPPTCFSFCNGSFSASWTGGTQPYNIIHVPPSQPQYTSTGVPSGIVSYTGICSGLHTFSVTDANGCPSTFNTFITQPSQLTANFSTTSVTCNSFSNGAFAVAPSGGTPNYTVNFSIGAPQNTGPGGTVTSSGLPAGPISATVSDANGCTFSVSSTINQPAASLSIAPSQTNVSCNGGNNGIASALVSGGTPTYAFVWSGSASTTSLASALNAGVKSVTVTDQNGCVATQGYTITEPGAMVLTPSSTNIVCNGANTGAISITGSGGTGAFTYTWVAPGPSTISTGAATSINTLVAGAYSIFASDANLCTSSVVVTLTQSPSFTLTLTSQSITCFGLNNGSATISALGGNGAPFTYTWSAGTGTANNTSTISTSIGQGNQSVLVNDAAGCAATSTFFIAEPATFTAAVTPASLSCNSPANGTCNGSVTTNPAGGVAPFSYTLVSVTSTLTAGPAAGATSFTGICANNYTVNIRDASNCPFTATFNISQPSLLTATATVPTMSCSNSTVVAVASATGGNGPYTFTWTSPPSATATGVNLSISAAGVYTLQAFDSRTCVTQSTINVTSPSSITINVAGNNISCNNGTNGTLSSTVSGGTPLAGPTYNYLWSNAGGTVSTLANPVGLGPGTYTLLVTDANSCSRTATGSITSPPAISTTVLTTSVVCNGQSNATATVLASGGTPGIPSYTFSINSPTPVTNTTGQFSGLPFGVYTASVQDNNGCIQTATLGITQPPALTANITGSVGSCSASNGGATVTAGGGNGGYTYNWTPSGGSNSISAALAPNNYTVTVTDASLCSTTATVNIPFIVNLTVTPAGPISVSCNSFSNAVASVTVSGGTPNYSVNWTSSGSSNTISTTGSVSITNSLSAGSWTIQAIDQAGCTNTAVLVINQPPAITVAVTGQTNQPCFNQSPPVGAVTMSISGGTGPYTQTWSPSGGNGTGANSLTAGFYTLNVLDFNLCPASRTVQITEPSSITISTSSTNPSGCTSNNGSICATGAGGNGGPFTYSIVSGPTITPAAAGCFTGLPGGNYVISVSDVASCVNTVNVILSTPSSPTLTINSSSIACFGGTNAAISVTAAGSAPFGITSSPVLAAAAGGNTWTTTGAVPSGTYFITATDVNLCVTTQSVGIATAPQLSINAVPVNALCHTLSTTGSTAGVITVSPTGGTPGSPTPFTYLWQPTNSIPTGQGTRTVSGLLPGTYSLNVTDGNACVTQHVFTITAPNAITLTAASQSLLCNAQCNGSISVTAGGGTGILGYNWTSSPTTAITGANTATATGLCAASGTTPITYSITVVDQNTCALVNTFTLAQPTALNHSILVLNPSCSNSCNAVATQTINGGTPGYTYSWSSSAATSVTLGGLCAGTFSGTATDGNGCPSTKAYTVVAPAAFSASITPTDPLCNSACNGSISTTLTGAQGTVAYVWSPGSASGANPTGLCAGPYQFTVTDQSNCVTSSSTTLTNPPAVLASVSASNPVCHTGTNGAAAVSFTNATSPTTYTWLSSAGTITQTSQSIASLSPASYSVIVTDVNSCTAQATFTLQDPPSYTVTSQVANSTCSLATGAITVNVSGGTPGSPTPYTYTWVAGTTGNASVVTNVASGLYSVQVTDAAGCQTLVPVTVNDIGGPNSVSFLTTSVNCFGDCTGQATVSSVTGGSAPFTYSWLPPASGASSVVTNLCAGDYSVEITDNNGCKFFPGTNISGPNAVSITSSSVNPLCFGVCDGSIAVSHTGGIAPFTYSWTSSVTGTLPSSASLTSLCSGDYTLTLGYNAVCAVTQTYNFPNQNLITISPTLTNNACFGDANGVITVSVNGGNAPYTISWSNSQTGVTASNLPNGSYTVIVVDNSGCKDSLVNAITSAPQLSLSASITQPSCGLNNGAATASVNGGTAPYTFSWSTGSNSQTISGLLGGAAYVLTATDSQSCTSTQTILVNNSNGITGENFNVTPIPCAGTCNGAVTVTPLGGNPPIVINWVNPAISGASIGSLCPGTYFVNMTDAQNCTRIASVTIDPLVTLTLSPFISPPSCSNSDGSVNVVVNGGTSPYTYTWTTTPPTPTSVNTSSLVNLGAGTYTLLVVESSTNNCSTSTVISLSNPGGPTISSTVTPNPCFGNSLAVIQTIGSSTAGAIAYNWSNGSSTSSLSGLSSPSLTTLQLTVSSTNGTVVCLTLQTFTLLDPPALRLNTVLLSHPTCFAQDTCDGSIVVQAIGGFAPYNYNWSNSSSGSVNDTLCEATYTLNLSDANTCLLDTSFTLISLSNISVTATSFSSSCSSVKNGSISMNLSGGVPQYSVSWQGPFGFSSNSISLDTIYSGDYIYTVVDSAGCRKSDTLTVAPTITIVAAAGLDTILCPFTGNIVLSASTSTGAVTYEWYQLPDNSNTVSATADHTVQNLFDPTFFMLVATSSVQACNDRDTVFVDMYPLPLAEAGTSTTIPLDATVQIGGNPTGPTAVNYTWQPGIFVTNSTVANPASTNTITMVFTVTVEDDKGCISSDTIRVTILPEIYFTNAFSPNGDLKNDLWLIDYIDQFPGSIVEIYNRWGEQLFRSEDYVSAPFDGKYKGQNLPVGTYYSIISLKTPKNGIKTYTGPLTIFR